MDFHITRGHSGSRLGLLLHHQVWRFPLRRWNIYITHSGEERLFTEKPLDRFSITALLRDLPPMLDHVDSLYGLSSFRIEEA
jgi:hypothetical protein